MAKIRVAFATDVLGVKNYDGSVKSKIPPPVEAQAIVLNQNTPGPEEIENIEMQNLGDTLDQINEITESL